MAVTIAKQAKGSNRGSRPGERRGGRKKGAPNKTTAEVRVSITKLAEANVERCQEWLDQVAETSPEKALDLFLRLLEYHVPKLARAEVTGSVGAIIITATPLDERL